MIECGEEKRGTDNRFITPRAPAGQVTTAGGNISSDDSFVSPQGYSSAGGAGYHSQGYQSAVSHYSTDENFVSPRNQDYLVEEVKSGRADFHSARGYKDEGKSSNQYNYENRAKYQYEEDETNLEDFETKDVEDIFSYARHNRVEDLERLLDAGMPVNIRDQYGNTILAVACQNGHKRSAKAALRRGADINARNYRGNTPLHFCYTYGYGETLGKYLISKGADPTIRNNDGVTCYEGIRK